MDSKKTLYQAGDLEYFALGNYEGILPSQKLLAFGDTGIGTFHCANGEMIVLDGAVYQAACNGCVYPAEDMSTPLADIMFFEPVFKCEFTHISSIEALKSKLMEIADSKGKNLFYMTKITGNFKKIHVRSAYPQTKPFKPLEILLKTDEVLFEYENLAGTIIGLYCPESISKLNSSGWHFHFISADKTKGGHLLDVSFDKAALQIDLTDNFKLITN